MKKPKKKEKEAVHEKLKGFDIRVNEFGQLITSQPVEKINRFLDENVEDKKLLEKESVEKTNKKAKKK
jgi:hypothetical protein